MKKIKLIIIAIVALSVTQCTKPSSSSDPTPTLNIPATYDSSGFAGNTSNEVTMQEDLENVIGTIEEARDASITLNQGEILSIYNNQIKSKTQTEYQPFIEGWIKDISKASGKTFEPSATITGTGGTYIGKKDSSYLFDAYGADLGEIIEKTMFGAYFYNNVLLLLDQPLTTTTVDKMVVLFGASPLFPNSYTTNNTKTPDVFMANYATRRDKNDGKGYYTQAKTALITLKVAINGGNSYKNYQTQAISDFKKAWEKAAMASVINYCKSTIGIISKTNPSPYDYSRAMHACSEAAGFAFGWYYIPQAHKIITKAQLDEILPLLNLLPNGTSTFYKLKTDSFNQVTSLNLAITKLQAIYGFTNEEVNDFGSNWVSVQKR
ncbi:MAG: hypothetical protein SFY32_09555 [Bacteroidota bacterium]|nr:hypothetical protein [Bacteroidota bacterium]